MKNKRMANMELLRIIAMLMVITLHYLDKGLLLPNRLDGFTVDGGFAWILQSLSIVAVNVYVLITGYFLVESKFYCKKLIKIILQVLFYSFLIPLCMIGVGLLQIEDITINQWIQYSLPLLSKHYWFATAYVILYIFSPILNRAIKSMNEKQHKITIVILTLVFVIPKSIIPIELAMDEKGHDVLWFICLYFIAAYIRLYGLSYFKNFKKSFITYIFLISAIFILSLLTSIFVEMTGLFGGFIERPYDYNHLFGLLGGISLFYSFLSIDIKKEKITSVICKVAPYTFGVYLLHEHIEIRFLWTSWVDLGLGTSGLAFLIEYLVAVIVVFGLGVSVDFIRSLLFKLIGSKLETTKIAVWLEKIDKEINQ